MEPKTPAEGDKKTTFAYDYMGRRIKKETHAWQASAWVKTDETRYLYDGWNMIRELNASGQTKKSYVWGIDLSGTLQGAGGIGGLVASVEPSTGTHAHYFFDGNGNVTQAVDAATGAPLAHYEYDPFGNVTYSHGAMASSNPYRFSTKYHDDDTALVYYGYRYYSPAMGRWLNRDPIGEVAFLTIYVRNYVLTSIHSGPVKFKLNYSNSILSRNDVAFINNDPINLYDLLGLADQGSLLEVFSGELLKELFGDKIIEWPIENATGAICVKEYCSKKKRPGDYYSAVDTCIAIFDRLNIPTGVNGSTANLVISCANFCRDNTNTEKFKDACLDSGCDK